MLAAGWVIAMAVFSGCDLGLLSLPVEYLAVEPLLADRGALHSRAGLYWSVRNASSRTIVAIDISFDLYDGNGRPVPSRGANAVAARVTAVLPGGSVGSWVTRLDDSVPPDVSGLVVGRFRVTRVVFENGEEWHNLAGVTAGNSAR